MKANGSYVPDANFCVEELPNKPGIALVRFFENVQEDKKTEGESTKMTYSYDEYHLELRYYNNIELDIKANFDTMLNQAKVEEEQKNLTMESLRAENNKLKTKLKESQDTITNLQIALCNFYEDSL